MVSVKNFLIKSKLSKIFFWGGVLKMLLKQKKTRRGRGRTAPTPHALESKRIDFVNPKITEKARQDQRKDNR